jgi:hypothetical protein
VSTSAPLSTAFAALRVDGTAIALVGCGSPFRAATCAATSRSFSSAGPVGEGGPARRLLRPKSKARDRKGTA